MPEGWPLMLFREIKQEFYTHGLPPAILYIPPTVLQYLYEKYTSSGFIRFIYDLRRVLLKICSMTRVIPDIYMPKRYLQLFFRRQEDYSSRYYLQKLYF